MWSALFPGQGSQHPGMGKYLFEEFKIARETFEEAGDTLKIDFKKLCFDGSDEDLALTKNTQPALLLVSTATYRVLKTLANFKPVAYSGHSVGEYAALVATDALTLPNALKAVRRRGEAMQEAVPVGEGAMAAVMGLTPIQVIEMCQWVEKTAAKDGFQKPLEPANFNCPGQIVISGRATLLEWAQKNFTKEVYPQVFSEKADGGSVTRVKFIPLKVSAPFHCSMMRPAEDVMRTLLTETEFNSTSTPVVQNFTALPTTNANSLRENVIRQISAPVRWIECTEQMHGLGATKFVELGSGKVLGGLVKKILGEKATTYPMNSLEELKAVTSLLN
jgi:[acyl-carrier-protein] S-malonyltransferase